MVSPHATWLSQTVASSGGTVWAPALRAGEAPAPLQWRNRPRLRVRWTKLEPASRPAGTTLRWPRGPVGHWSVRGARSLVVWPPVNLRQQEKTEDSVRVPAGGRSRRAALVTVGLTAAWLLAAPAAAQPASPAASSAATPTRLVVSAGAGVLVPGDAVVSDVYGTVVPAVVIEAEVPVGSWFRACAGARFSRATGTTISETPGAAVDRDEVTLRTWTIRAGGEVSRPIASQVRWFAGAAAAFGRFREQWESVPLVAEGNLAGVVAAGGFHYEFARRLGVVGRVEYSYLRASEPDPDGKKHDLGGLELSAGVSVRF